MSVDSRTTGESDSHRRRDVEVALRTIASMQDSIRHADTKSAGLSGILGSLAAVGVDHLIALSDGAGGALAPAVWSLAALLMVGCGAAAWHLTRAVAPRLGGPSGPNRFAFPNVAGSPRPVIEEDPLSERDEAWATVAALARIALAKHLRVRASLSGLILAATSTVALVGLDMLSRSLP